MPKWFCWFAFIMTVLLLYIFSNNWEYGFVIVGVLFGQEVLKDIDNS